MDCLLNKLFTDIQNSGLTVVSCCGIFSNPSRQYSKRQTRGEEIEKCLDGGLEPTYYFSIFTSSEEISGTMHPHKSKQFLTSKCGVCFFLVFLFNK